MAAFVWIRWQASPGFDGSFALDWVAGITGIRNHGFAAPELHGYGPIVRADELPAYEAQKQGYLTSFSDFLPCGDPYWEKAHVYTSEIHPAGSNLGRKKWVFNAFYPRMKEFYESPGSTFIAFVLREKPTERHKWEEVEKSLVGTEFGLRREVFTFTPGAYYNLRRLSDKHFGWECSKSFFESIRDVLLWAGMPEHLESISATLGGSTLLACGLSLQQIKSMLSNPAVTYQGETLPVFDLFLYKEADVTRKIVQEIV